MKSLLIWIMTALLFTAVGGVVAYFVLEAREEHGEVEHGPEASQVKTREQRTSRDEAGNVTVRLSKESQTRLGVEVKPLTEALHRPSLTAYGTLQEDPARGFTLRAPLAGRIHADRWPALGDMLADKTAVGFLEPRLGPVEQADLAARLAAAQADVQQARASLEAKQATVERQRRLHAEGRIVSEQALQEAEAQLTGEEARLKGALATVQILESSISATSRPADAIPLVVETGGRVVDLPIGEGEVVENGQEILRVSRFDRLIARVSLPVGESVDEHVIKARVVVPGHEEHPLPAERAGVAAAADTLTGGQTLLFLVHAHGVLLQPGMSAIAYLELPGEPRKGVIVPRSAVVRVGGAAWVYVPTGEESFTRQRLPVDTATPEGWFVAEVLKDGDKVVIRGAQSVLSEELKFGAEEEEE